MYDFKFQMTIQGITYFKLNVFEALEIEFQNHNSLILIFKHLELTNFFILNLIILS